MKDQNPTKHVNVDLNNVDHVSSNLRSSRFGAVLYVFEDNEAVIKMIIKGRSPTMRHVSRTHRVALDLLFERMNLDPKNSNQVYAHLSLADGRAELFARAHGQRPLLFRGQGVPRSVPIVGRGPWVGCGQLDDSGRGSESGSCGYLFGR